MPNIIKDSILILIKFVNFETSLSVLSVKFPLVKYQSAKCDSSQLFGFI